MRPANAAAGTAPARAAHHLLHGVFRGAHAQPAQHNVREAAQVSVQGRRQQKAACIARRRVQPRAGSARARTAAAAPAPPAARRGWGHLPGAPAARASRRWPHRCAPRARPAARRAREREMTAACWHARLNQSQRPACAERARATAGRPPVAPLQCTHRQPLAQVCAGQLLINVPQLQRLDAGAHLQVARARGVARGVGARGVVYVHGGGGVARSQVLMQAAEMQAHTLRRAPAPPRCGSRRAGRAAPSHAGRPAAGRGPPPAG